MKLTDELPSSVWVFPDCYEDIANLDKSRRIKVLKAIAKIAQAPTAFGKPLENQAGRPLAGFRSAYTDGKKIRIIWTVAESGQVQFMVLATVAERDGMFTYELAVRRRPDIEIWLRQKLGGK